MAAVLTLLLAAVTVRLGWKRWDDSIGAQTGVSVLAALADSHIERYVNSLEILAATREVQSADFEVMAPLLEKVAQGWAAATVWFVLPDGSYYLAGLGKQSANLSDRPYFPRVMAGNVVVGDLVVGRSTGKKSVVATVPVMKGQKVIGALGSTIFLNDLSATLSREMGLTGDQVFYAVTAGNEVALHSDPANIMADNPELPKKVAWRTSSLTGWRFALGAK